MNPMLFSWGSKPVRVWIATLALLCWGSASAGLFDDEEARRAILDLRQANVELKQQIDALKSDAARSSEEKAQLRRGLLDLQNQLEAARADLAKLVGQGEKVARDLSDTQRQHKDFVQFTEERFRKLEPTRITLDGREFSAEPSEKKDYDAGVAVFRKGDFANAQLAFVDFLNRYPQSGYRPSALFWLGNAQYATRDYKDAMANFRSLVTLAPDHVRVPDSLLAIANCQLEIKENKAARKTWEELLAKYPGTEAAAAAKDRLARFK